MIRTAEGGHSHEFSMSHMLEFFSKAGSLFTKRGSFYGVEETALSLFQKAWVVNRELTFKLLLFLRDIRGGAGNRSGARECYRWLADNDPTWLQVNLDWLVQVGRWDDLRCLFSTNLEYDASYLWASAIIEGNVLAAKWADRDDFPIRRWFNIKVGDFRRLLASIRKQHIVEHKMCSNTWNEVEYKTVPSVAMSRYTNAFKRHDEERFNTYKESLKRGETTVHAGVLFPHDCVRTVLHGDEEIGEAQFNALPNYLKTDDRIIVISDTSGSMEVCVSGSVRAVHISQGMALYCSAKIPEDNPFHKKFIGFCSESSFKNWNRLRFSEAVRNCEIFNGAVGSTRIDIALDLILESARNWNLREEQLPTTLLIVSDMQFHQGCGSGDTEVERSLKKWDKYGYPRPKIVYWNTAGYPGSQDIAYSEGIGMVSGFSPAILSAIFSAEDFSPIGIMLRTIEKYKINIP